MKRKCKECGMIRSEKDLVHFEDGSYLCFSCWNKKTKFFTNYIDKKNVKIIDR
ncbi:MAG: hypothetical protein GF383_14340 [Candidatus Lokiarchaeota archaeon]|nr:hypothetical protein [Candidatus Lokiarchaeota archaeon]